MNKLEFQRVITLINERLGVLDKRVDENKRVLHKLIHEFDDLFKMLTSTPDFSDFDDSDFPPDIFEKNEKKSTDSVYIKDSTVAAKFLFEQMEQLRELQKELEKYEDEFTPGTLGES